MTRLGHRVLSFPFQLLFLLARYPDVMSRVLGIVYRTLATHLIRKAGYTHKLARTGAVTLIQRFGSALNLNIHFHMLFLDGVFTTAKQRQTIFVRTKAQLCAAPIIFVFYFYCKTQPKVEF